MEAEHTILARVAEMSQIRHGAADSKHALTSWLSAGGFVLCNIFRDD
jgi:hypothetical protein